MSSVRFEMLAFVSQRWAAILAAPGGWGHPEALEGYMLLLIEMRLVALEATAARVYATNDRYTDFLERVTPGKTTSLAVRLGLTHTATPEFLGLLQRFAHEEGLT